MLRRKFSVKTPALLPSGKTLAVMLNDSETRQFVKSSGDCPSWTFPTDFCNQTISPLTTFSWDSPALTFRKKLSDRQSFNITTNAKLGQL